MADTENNIINEEWKPIPGYEGFYSVSNLGRVRSESRPTSNGGTQRAKLLTVRPHKGKPSVRLSRDSKRRLFTIARLIALGFNRLDITDEPLEGEQWRPIAHYEHLYSISNYGRVRRDRDGSGTHAGKILRCFADRDGYILVNLCNRQSMKTLKVHALVARAFIGPCPDSQQINHKDGNKANNQPCNLEYCTVKENIHHAMRLGLRATRRGAHRPSSQSGNL